MRNIVFNISFWVHLFPLWVHLFPNIEDNILLWVYLLRNIVLNISFWVYLLRDIVFDLLSDLVPRPIPWLLNEDIYLTIHPSNFPKWFINAMRR
jgi:hypothetical protein